MRPLCDQERKFQRRNLPKRRIGWRVRGGLATADRGRGAIENAVREKEMSCGATIPVKNTERVDSSVISGVSE